MMRFLNAKARVTLGLVGILISLVLLGFFLNIVPDEDAAAIERRTVLAETIAVYSTALVKIANVQRLTDDFELLRERNRDLLSLALRHHSGSLLVATSDHGDHWQEMTGSYSSGSQVQVPIWSGKQQWGQLELRFAPLAKEGFWGILMQPMIQMVLFVGSICFLIYYYYLGRVLRQLDPSKAVPSRVRSALDTMAEGLLILDRKEQIVLANLAFGLMMEKSTETLTGYRASELPWTDTDGESLKNSERPWVEALKKGAIIKDKTVRLQLPDGHHRTFKTNSSPVLGDGGKYAGVLVSFDDITELEKKELELLNSKLEAEEANKAKSAFLANMSHEIRTPMNSILGFAELLMRGYVKNEQESLKYLNTIHTSGKNLLELINDILDLSKVESGNLELECCPVSPYPILHEVIQMLQVKAQEKGISLVFEATDNLPEMIITDPVRLRQIAFNLIGNSVKFTESGGVVVRCRIDDLNAEPKLIIDIIDTGIGMSQAALEKIFDPFIQADSSVGRRFGGTGLGLAISKRFVRALGGEISVTSEVGKGSCFSVSLATGSLDGVAFLTAEHINKLQQVINVDSGVRWRFPQGKVLVVDDGPENRELIRLLLEEAGLSMDEAENGHEGVQKALAENYDVILMDVNMPVMDGFAATGILRAKGVMAPIVALTANAMKGFADDCLQAGFSSYLSKPIDIDIFMSAMAEILGGQRLSETENVRPLEASKAEPQESAEPLVDRSPIYPQLPLDNERFRSIATRFVERLQDLIQELNAAEEANDCQQLASLAHTIKGSGGTVGLAVLTDPATSLEEAAKQGDRAQIQEKLQVLRQLAERIVPPAEKNAPAGLGAKLRDGSPPPEAVTGVTENDLANQPVVSRLAENPRMQRIIRQFVAEFENKLRAMQQALQENDFAALANLAHWLKGSGGSVGYNAFTVPAETLENFAKTHQLEPAAHAVENLEKMLQNIVVPDHREEEKGREIA